jgi:PAS domain S-box-containing protein
MMSTQHENEISTAHIRESKPQPIQQFSPIDEKQDEQPGHTTSKQTGLPGIWRFLRNWFVLNTFAPAWLPTPLRHPALGYLVALLLQAAAVIITVVITRFFPTYSFVGLPEALALVLVALSWGGGPAFFATLVGAVLLGFTTLPPVFSLKLDTTAEGVGMLVFLLVGCAISIGASQTERARRQSEQLAQSLAAERTRLATIIDTVPDAVSIHDAAGTIVQLNRAGRQNSGPQGGNETLDAAHHKYRVRSVTGRPMSTDELPVTRALRGETVTNTEIIFLDTDGHDRQALLSAAPLLNEQGDIDGVVLITRDITALRQTEREQQNRANELIATFEAMADAIFVFDRQGGVRQMNATARQFFALDPDSDYSRPLAERSYRTIVLDENGHPLPEEAWPFARVLRGETLTSANAVDMRLRTADGRDLELSVSGSPVLGPDGSIVGAVCICRDVTERRKLERRTSEALQALLTMAETLVSTSSSAKSGELLPSPGGNVSHRLAELTCSILNCRRAGIIAIDESNQLVPVAIVGLAPELEQRWWQDTAQARLEDVFDTSALERLQHGKVFLLDTSLPSLASAQQVYRLSSLLCAPMNLGDQLLGFIALDYGGADHEYTENEKSIAKAIARLTTLVIERERLLREREEARASELALREANRRMEEFLSIASHELRTPLTTIKGNTQLAIRQMRATSEALDRILKLFEGTDRQTRRLNRLVDDLLDVSRTQADRLELFPVPCDLADIVREVVEEQRSSWPRRTITLNLADDVKTPIFADPQRVAQVISNYLNNALKYSEEEKPVSVRLQVEGEQARVSVQDEGPGLSTEVQTHIWERFYRVPGIEVQSGSGVGLGLGLHITRAIIEQHHGQVGVESTPGQGSTFWFSLPVAPSP